ncbi:TIGR00269 family protein [Sulfuracidifex tepidarius]|uniref:tRNA 2-thiocytidine biosynthesis protein TtcA n=1 Tax=Sulfuracidifex tepidarius TaxID=1294262 RepID=A0A510DVU7_9CREN|nr:TIGR00269 family protein [Sulfuracidifex tepidarius]BBG24351.1 tRNA 2-thiocytidine biosynthesis protein TtcA [Sulfuracidifex tepidarius]BBG27108.1 tRNA 2-thiocytidine biosynthesis protein TtcA [Sulfuracidifex tepidarius]
MNCSKCNGEAVIRIAHANLSLCSVHFIEWLEERVERTVEKYKMLEGTKRLGIAVSGGKDSTTLLHVMKKIADKKGIEILGINVDLGIDQGKLYSSKSTEMALKNFEMLGIKYRIVNLEREYGFSIDEAKRGIHRPVCSTCGLSKRYITNWVALEEGLDTVATGHNVNDNAQFIMMGYLTGDVSNLSRLRSVAPSENGLIKKIKPLFLTYEKETLTYALLKKIPFILDSCPNTFRVGGRTQDSIRRNLEEMEDKVPGYMLNLVESFERKIRPALEEKYLKKEEVGKCKICGMPTSKDRDICSFCAVRIKMKKVKSLT